MPRVLDLTVAEHSLDGMRRSVATWRPVRPVRCVASAALGGGLGPRHWVLNATVDADYAGPDPAEDLRAIAAALDLTGDGVGLMTAVDVREARWAADEGVEAVATVGLGWPTWAAAPAEPHRVVAGTINLVAWLPVRLSDAAMVNAVATATEAKVQALGSLGVPGTGTASDALALCCPIEGPEEPYGGPRSTWGARLARAVHAAVIASAGPR